VYFWNVRGLVDDLRAGRLTEREKVRYLLPQVVLTAFGLLFGLAMPTVYFAWLRRQLVRVSGAA